MSICKDCWGKGEIVRIVPVETGRDNRGNRRFIAVRGKSKCYCELKNAKKT